MIINTVEGDLAARNKLFKRGVLLVLRLLTFVSYIKYDEECNAAINTYVKRMH